jgi:hypothetical protein
VRPVVAVRDPEPGEVRSRAVRGFEVLAIAAAVAVFVAVTCLSERPRFVARLQVVNLTAFDLDVEATTADHDGWMSVAIARRASTTTAEEIYDIGDSWVFRFHAQGKTSSDVAVSRQELADSGWVFTVPSSVADELVANGAVPPP